MRAGRIEAAAERVGPCRPPAVDEVLRTSGDSPDGGDAAGDIFNVRDPGADGQHDIETVSRTALATPAAGFWIIERR